MYLSNMHICYVELPLGVSIFNREKTLRLQNQEQFALFFQSLSGCKIRNQYSTAVTRQNAFSRDVLGEYNTNCYDDEGC